MHRTSILLAFAAFLATALSTMAVSDDDVAVDPSVWMIKTFGLWDDDGRHGRYRLVVTKGCSLEHCFDRARLEWLELISDLDGRYARTAVIRIVNIAELGDFFVVKAVTPAPTESDPNRFELITVNSYSQEEGHICIWPSGPGEYRAREGPCDAAA